jgi:hypothetical protein
MTHGTTIAIAAIVFAVLVFIDVLRANRALALIPPASSESDEDCSAHCHAELDGSGLPAGMINHFHAETNPTNGDRNHA